MRIFQTLRDNITDHIQYRQQIGKLAKADVVRTYRGSALGWAWALIKPSVTIFIYWVAFSFGLRTSSGPVEGYPFFFWLIAGMIPWFYMQSMILSGTHSIKKYSYLVTKMKFPISTIPTFVSISNLLVNLGLTIILIAIFVANGYLPDIYYLQLPFYTLCMFLFFTVLAMFTAPLAAISKDFYNLIRSLITGIFWLSGVILNLSNISNPIFKAFLTINPVTYICNGYRNVFIYKTWFFQNPTELIAFAAMLIIFLLLGLFVYERVRKDIPDVL